MKIISCFMLIFIVFSCRNSKKMHLRTNEVCWIENKSMCNKLYVEVFSDLGVGLPGSDLTYDYLTDSSYFRLSIGKYDDVSEILTTEIKGDSVIIIKSTNEGQSQEWEKPKVLDKKIYSLIKLKKQGLFQ